MDARLAEYQALRQEIVSKQTMVLQVQGLMLVASSAGLAYAADQDNRWVFLVVPFIVISCMYHVVGLYHGMFRVGRYIQLFIEPHVPGLGWEAEWSRYQSTHTYRSLGTPASAFVLSSVGLNVASLVGLATVTPQLPIVRLEGLDMDSLVWCFLALVIGLVTVHARARLVDAVDPRVHMRHWERRMDSTTG